MGPGDGIQIQRLMDLPTTLETAEQAAAVGSQSSLSSASQASSQQQRVKSMLPNPPLPMASKLPQRSVSHNEVSCRRILGSAECRDHFRCGFLVEIVLTVTFGGVIKRAFCPF